MKMRQYVDTMQGAGSWDRMHDMIDRKVMLGWVMPPITVDGVIVKIVPGMDREVTLEEVRTQARRVLRQAASFRQIEVVPRPTEEKPT